MAKRTNHMDGVIARKANTRAARRSDEAGPIWVNYTLTDVDKAELARVMSEQPTALNTELETALQEGYRFSVRYDSFADCFAVAMYDPNQGAKNFGKMLNSRSKDWMLAVMMTVWKHTVIFQGEWLTTTDEERDWEG